MHLYGYRLIATTDFVENGQQAPESIGLHALQGIEAEQELFTYPVDAA